MPKKSSKLIWLTSMGQNMYENLNPYWAYCERFKNVPEQIALLHAIEMNAEKDRTVRAFSIISGQYCKNKQINIAGISFDDEDVRGFSEKAEAVFKKASAENMKLIVDVSLTTWSFVPIYLMKMTRNYHNIVKSLVYFQYSEHCLRSRPYPLIPRPSTTFHDLLAESGKKDRKEQVRCAKQHSM
ncbi:MAG: hypothetical protein U9R02_08195 [Thermodesulfobacteriota bacterium]|nr:hypothetical protein [Thermodesulfobacteriota bacterium]